MAYFGLLWLTFAYIRLTLAYIRLVMTNIRFTCEPSCYDSIFFRQWLNRWLEIICKLNNQKKQPQKLVIGLPAIHPSKTQRFWDKSGYILITTNWIKDPLFLKKYVYWPEVNLKAYLAFEKIQIKTQRNQQVWLIKVNKNSGFN